MYKYIILNALFILVAAAVLARTGRPGSRTTTVVAVMLLLTLVFDNVLIGLDIVRYDSGSILGIVIGKAPIEDFAYALVAAVVMPVVWSKLKRHS